MLKYCFALLLCLCCSVAVSQNFAVYVSDAGNFNIGPWQIVQFDQNGQNPTTFINANLNWPQDIIFMEDSGFVLVSNLGSNKISRYDAFTGAYLSDFATGMSGPTRMKIGADGLLYVLQWSGNGRVLRYQLNGTFAGAFTSVGVPQSIGMDWDTNGNFYVSSYSGDLVRKFDASGVDLGIFISNNLAGPTNIWFDSGGDLLVSDYDGTAVKRFDTTGTYIGNFCTGLSHSEGFAYLPNGNLLIGNGASSSVKMFDSNGMYLQDFIAPNSGNLLNPNAIVIRDITNVGISETVAISGNLLYPTMGAEFNITPGLTKTIERLLVYALTGKMVGVVSGIQENESISFPDLADGIYLVKVIFNNGRSQVEKIIVKN